MSDAAFSALKQAFKGDLVTPIDPDYPSAIARWASNAELKAKLVAFVKDEGDVALALKYAKSQKLQVAVRGGGHSTSGASSTDGGVVIDLSRHLNKVWVDPEAKLGYCGGGSLWEAVDKAAIEHGLATVGGTVNHTGVGGLVLGGGFGWLTGTHGLAIDNLHQVTIVVADGTMHVANRDKNTDLFWGVRGGGGNFGVVTEFVLRLHPQRRTVFAGPVVFPKTAFDSVTEYISKWWQNGPTNKEALLEMLTRGPDRTPCIVVILFYNGSEAEGRAAYKGLFDIGPVADRAKEIPYEELNGLMSAANPHGLPTYFKGVVLSKIRSDTIKKAFDRLLELSADPEFSIGLSFEFFPHNKVLSVPADATAFNRRPNANVLNITRWKENTPKNLAYAREAAHSVTDIIAKGNVETKQMENLGYGNYGGDAEAEGLLPGDFDGYAFSARSEAYYGENYPKLQALKKKYDPEVIFSKWFVVSPA